MLAALLQAAWLAVAGAAPLLRVVAARGGGEASGGPSFLREGESGTLAVVVEDGGRCFAAGPAPAGPRGCEPLDPAALASIRWYSATPRARDYDNAAFCGATRAGGGCHAPVEYDVRELSARSGKGRIDPASEPALAAPGTHRVGAAIVWRGTPLASAPGLGRGGAGEETARVLLQVVVRRDDTYVGYLTEQLGTPFVYAPARVRGEHQTDARAGADCAALLVYGRRRMGEPLRYVSPGGLRAYAEPIGDAPVRAGDVLHFGFQTAAISVDNPPFGRLDDSDLVIHTYHGAAEEVPFGTLPYRRARVEVLRWTSAAPAPASERAGERQTR